MIICVVNDAEKLEPDRLIKWTVRSERVICERDITSGHQTQSSILQGIQYLAISLHDPAIIVLLL